jgi:hypothetical protein
VNAKTPCIGFPHCREPALEGLPGCATHQPIYERTGKQLKMSAKHNGRAKSQASPVVVTKRPPILDGPEQLARVVHERGEATRKELAKLLDASERTVSRWGQGALVAGYIKTEVGTHGGYKAGDVVPPA